VLILLVRKKNEVNAKTKKIGTQIYYDDYDLLGSNY